MTRPLPTCVRTLIDSHFSGTISVRRERAMRAHLTDCEACRDYYNRHLLLATVDPRATSPEQRIAVGLGLRAGQPTAPTWLLAVGLCAFAALAVAAPLSRMRAPEFASRGPLGESKPQFFVYRMDPTTKLTDHGSVIKSEDNLAFAYTNPTGYGRLLVYGVDEHRHVYWYYPGWSTPDEDPHAISVARGADIRELPEAIRHELDGHVLTIHALFLDDDTSVTRVERMVVEAQSPDDPLPIPGASEQRLSLTVEP